MGKVRKQSGTSQLVAVSSDDPSRSSKKVTKIVSEKLVGSQNINFKAKTGDTSGYLSSFKGLSQKVRKMKLKKDILEEVVTKKLHVRNKVQATDLVCEGLSPGSLVQTVSSRKKKERYVHEEDKPKPPFESFKQQVKKCKITHDIPLAVEMPQVIDASDSTLNELNYTLEGDVTMETSGSISDADSSSVIPLLASDSQSSDHNVDDTADIPLAVFMPGGTPEVLSEGSNDKTENPSIEKTDLDIPTKCQSVKSKICTNAETREWEVNSASVSHKATTKKVPSHKDNLLENILVHLVGSSVVLELIHPVEFFIFGQVKVQVLQGEIQIFGYKMNNQSGSKVISSLRGSSFLSIRTVQPKGKRKVPLNLPVARQNEDALKSLIMARNSNHVWVLFKEENQDFLEYIRMYLGYPISPKELKNDEISPLSQAQEALGCIIQPESALGKRLNELEAWKGVSQKIIQDGRSCTVLCGGKGVGKSTLLRYLINQILSNEEHAAKGVVVLDFDPGQAELTPPGCLGLSLIKEPLLGPNYSHLQSPQRCVFIGEINVTQCLGRYMEAAAHIIKYCNESLELSSLPCIVNTMGFTQGIGVTIMGQLLKLLRPNRVVQIDSMRLRDNYPFRLSPLNVLSHLNRSDSRCISDSLQLAPSGRADLTYQFIRLLSAAETKTSKDENVWGMSPKVSRNAVILSYFSSLVQPPSFSILDDVPFSCPLGSLFLCVAHEQVPPNLILSAINGNMVSLCCIDPQTSDVICHEDPSMPRVLTKVPIAPCIGFGIVRGIDMDAKMLYLTTPLKEEKLSLVNCLIFGAVNLPPSIYIKSTAPGLVPYVSTGHHPELSSQS